MRPSLGRVADGFDVVAVGIAHERAVVGRVVLGPDARLVQHLGAGRDRGVEEGAHRGPVGATNATWIGRLTPSASGPSQNDGCSGVPKPITSPKSIWRLPPSGARTVS